MQIKGLEQLVDEQQQQDLQDNQFHNQEYSTLKIKHNVPYSNLLARRINQINLALLSFNIVFYLDIYNQFLYVRANQIGPIQSLIQSSTRVSQNSITIRQFLQQIVDKYHNFLFNDNKQQFGNQSKINDITEQKEQGNQYIKNFNNIICNDEQEVEGKLQLDINNYNNKIYLLTFALPDYKSDLYQEEVVKLHSINSPNKCFAQLSKINQYCQYLIQVYQTKEQTYMQYYPKSLTLRKYNELNPVRSIEWNLIIMYRLCLATQILYDANYIYPKFDEDCILVYQYPSKISFHQIKLFKWSDCDNLTYFKELYKIQTNFELKSNTIDDILQEILNEMQKYEI